MLKRCSCEQHSSNPESSRAATVSPRTDEWKLENKLISFFSKRFVTKKIRHCVSVAPVDELVPNVKTRRGCFFHRKYKTVDAFLNNHPEIFKIKDNGEFYCVSQKDVDHYVNSTLFERLQKKSKEPSTQSHEKLSSSNTTMTVHAKSLSTMKAVPSRCGDRSYCYQKDLMSEVKCIMNLSNLILRSARVYQTHDDDFRHLLMKEEEVVNILYILANYDTYLDFFLTYPEVFTVTSNQEIYCKSAGDVLVFVTELLPKKPEFSKQSPVRITEEGNTHNSDCAGEPNDNKNEASVKALTKESPASPRLQPGSSSLGISLEMERKCIRQICIALRSKVTHISEAETLTSKLTKKQRRYLKTLYVSVENFMSFHHEIFHLGPEDEAVCVSNELIQLYVSGMLITKLEGKPSNKETKLEHVQNSALKSAHGINVPRNDATIDSQWTSRKDRFPIDDYEKIPELSGSLTPVKNATIPKASKGIDDGHRKTISTQTRSTGPVLSWMPHWS